MRKIDKEIIKALTSIVGRNNITTHPADLELHSYDASNNPHLPEVVVHPGSTEEVSEIMKLAWEKEFPVTPRGAGAGFTGGSVPVEGGLVLTTRRLNKIREIAVDDLTVIVEPGVITSALQAEVAKKGLFYPPDPASKEFSTIGGNVAESAGGPRAFKYGVTPQYILGLEVVLPDGTIMNTGSRTIKNVVGYNLSALIAGSEGTLAIITAIILRLIPKPEMTRTIQLLFPDVSNAAKTVSDLVAAKVIPTTIEIMDDICLGLIREHVDDSLPEDSNAALIVECDGDPYMVGKDIDAVRRVAEGNDCIKVRIAKNADEAEELWTLRRSLSPTIAKLWDTKVNEDIVVPRSKIPAAFEYINKLAAKWRLNIPTFGHAGDGNLHVNIMYNRAETGAGDRAHEAAKELFEFVVSVGGSISGEHGIGLSKAPFLEIELGSEQIELLKRIKHAFDPKGILNPGKIFK
ncbi:MAG: FAD-binding protein [Acidobacteria bacterium]|nr:FAD-binding protein [Acidobacteriota bacterium]